MKNQNKWNEKDIRELFNRLDKITGADSSGIPININNRLKTTVARYRWYSKSGEPCDFEFGKLIMNVDHKLPLDDVAIHEYAHWYVQNVLKGTAGHTPQFRKVVRMLGSTNVNATCTDYVKNELEYARIKLNRK